MYLFSPLLIVPFLYLLIMPIGAPLALEIVLKIASLAMTALFVYAILDAYKGRFVITHDRVILRSPFGIRMLMFEEIKGFKLDKKYIHIIPVDERAKKIKVSIYLEGTYEIIDWLANRYIDLSMTEKYEEEMEIVQNPGYGATEESRKRKLKEAKQVARVLNILSVVLLGWLAANPSPYEIAMLAGLSFPLLVIAVSCYYRGLIRGDEKLNKVYPSTSIAFILSICGLGLRVIVDFIILDHHSIWAVVTVITILIYGLYVIVTGDWKMYRSVTGAIFNITLLLFFFFYSYSFCVTTNCMLDQSKALGYEPRVIEKRVTTGKNASYHLTLEPWGERKESEEVRVMKTDFDRLEVGDPVKVFQKEGFMGMPWIIVLIE